ncbi:hypothetical protein EMIT0P74_20015 [Pseudomonas sp. IT-P74]
MLETVPFVDVFVQKLNDRDMLGSDFQQADPWGRAALTRKMDVYLICIEWNAHGDFFYLRPGVIVCRHH